MDNQPVDWQARAAELEATLTAVRAVHARYFDTDLPPGHEYSDPAPEDVWRLDRDLRAVLDGSRK